MVNEEAHDIGEIGDAQVTIPNRNVDGEHTVIKFFCLLTLQTLLVVLTNNLLMQSVKVVLLKKRFRFGIPSS